MRGHDRGIDWLRAFPGGLLTSCGPFNIGPPGDDDGEELGLHGSTPDTPATVESVIQPDPHAGRADMSITGVLRYGALFGPCVELRRTIASRLGANAIDFVDEFHNAGNSAVPHAWLLHINFGYPLVDAGAEFCYDAKGRAAAQPRRPCALPQRRSPTRKSPPRWTPTAARPSPSPTSTRARATAAPAGRPSASSTAGSASASRSDYSTKEFPRCVNWQHWGPGEYVTALEPANGTVEAAGRTARRACGHDRRWREEDLPLPDRSGQRAAGGGGLCTLNGK